MSDNQFPEIEDLEVLRLRKEILALKAQLQSYEAILEEHGLMDKTSTRSDAEIVCAQQIAKFKELSDKGIPFTIEDSKHLEILVKTLQIAQGKAPVVEQKKQTRKEKADVNKLLQIVGKHEPAE